MLVAKRVVDTLAVDPHVLHQVLDRSSLVTARPENLHSPMEDFIAIDLFLARHSYLRTPLYSLLERTFKNQRSYSQALPAECIVPPASHMARSCIIAESFAICLAPRLQSFGHQPDEIVLKEHR